MAFLACKKGEIYLLYDGGFMDVVVLWLLNGEWSRTLKRRLPDDDVMCRNM
jgi:hypothetical protein